MNLRKVSIVAALAMAWLCASGAAGAAGPDGAAPGTIAPGTTVTMQNWRQYKDFMPDGMAALFEGTYFWKMPADVELEIGPTVIHPLPKGYVEASEKYGPQVKLVELPDGGLTIQNYVAGIPFPTPSGPHKGWEILANLWYRYTPNIAASTPENPIVDCTQDSYGNIACEQELFVSRWLSHITDPGVAMVNPEAGDRDETRFGMVIQPEQRKYSSFLDVYYSDLTRLPSVYSFSPSERRVMQVSSASRCQPSNGSDMTADDFRYGFAGSIPEFSADLLGERKILALLEYRAPSDGLFPASYDMPLGWSKPDWGKWEVRDVYVIDVRKIPSKAAGYCYGKRIMYVDQQFYGPLWEDLYDRNMKLWKIAHLSPQVRDIPGIGLTSNSGSIFEQFWDVQSNHATYDASFDGHGHGPLVASQVPAGYLDLRRYGSPGGMSEIMR